MVETRSTLSMPVSRSFYTEMDVRGGGSQGRSDGKVFSKGNCGGGNMNGALFREEVTRQMREKEGRLAEALASAGTMKVEERVGGLVPAYAPPQPRQWTERPKRAMVYPTSSTIGSSSLNMGGDTHDGRHIRSHGTMGLANVRATVSPAAFLQTGRNLKSRPQGLKQMLQTMTLRNPSAFEDESAAGAKGRPASRMAVAAQRARSAGRTTSKVEARSRAGSPRDRQGLSLGTRRNFILENAIRQSTLPRGKRTELRDPEGPIEKHRSYGQTPAYLIKRREAEQALIRSSSVAPKAEYRKLEDEERVELVGKLTKKLMETEKLYSRYTLSLQNLDTHKKMKVFENCEREITQLGADIKLVSNPNLLVPV